MSSSVKLYEANRVTLSEVTDSDGAKRLEVVVADAATLTFGEASELSHQIQAWASKTAREELDRPKPGGHTCPRRDEGGLGYGVKGADTYETRGASRCCSYCGSLHPDEFMKAAGDGVNLDPTDKNYKVYVTDRPTGDGGKFYFQHLSAEQQKEFVELHNAKKLKIGYPGHFYTLPFFMRRAT